jgi:hypothetical protein
MSHPELVSGSPDYGKTFRNEFRITLSETFDIAHDIIEYQNIN